jgi:hypothetical protein
LLQIGHLERFNAGIMALAQRIDRPRFIEAQRMGGFKERATDVDVVTDLMIHDIDIILALLGDTLTEIAPWAPGAHRACGYRQRPFGIRRRGGGQHRREPCLGAAHPAYPGLPGGWLPVAGLRRPDLDIARPVPGRASRARRSSASASPSSR